MSRRILGYLDGRAIWSENDPGHGQAHGYLASAARHGYALTGGALVQGEPGIVERDRQATRKHMKRRRAS